MNAPKFFSAISAVEAFKGLTAECAECAKKTEHRAAITFSAKARRHHVSASGPLQPGRILRSLGPPACGIRFGTIAHRAAPGWFPCPLKGNGHSPSSSCDRYVNRRPAHERAFVAVPKNQANRGVPTSHSDESRPN